MPQTTMLVVRCWSAAALLSVLAVSTVAFAQDSASDTASNEETAATALADKQSRIADKYRRLEELLFKMEQLERGENPQRANLLREAIAHGRGEGIQLHVVGPGWNSRSTTVRRALSRCHFRAAG